MGLSFRCFPYYRQESFAIGFQLARADAADLAQRRQLCGRSVGQFAQVESWKMT
jgi:hypothetical protein